MPQSFGKALVYGTLAENKELQSDLRMQLDQVTLRFQEVQQETRDLGDFVRNADGSVRHMNQYDADKYCKDQGTRLPTAHELASYSQLLGAIGVSKIQHEGYSLIKGTDSKGNPANFYFSNRDYQRPEGDMGNYCFWSSSIDPDYSQSKVAYVLQGYNGSIVSTYRNIDYGNYAVWCVRTH